MLLHYIGNISCKFKLVLCGSVRAVKDHDEVMVSPYPFALLPVFLLRPRAASVLWPAAPGQLSLRPSCPPCGAVGTEL